jgi:hypothetical protein
LEQVLSQERVASLSDAHGKQAQRHNNPLAIEQEPNNFVSVFFNNPNTGKSSGAVVDKRLPTPIKGKLARQDLQIHDPKALAKAKRKFEIIQPLINNPNRTAEQIKAIAKANRVHYTSIYNWLRNFESTGTVSALIRQPRSDKGKTLLDSKLNDLISRCIEIHFLTNQKKSALKVISEIHKICAKQGMKAPHANTIRNRIKHLRGTIKN